MKEHKLLDYLLKNCGFKNDAKIAEAWGVSRPVISKIRSGSLRFTSHYILKTYDTTNLNIEAIRSLLRK
jgi:hypothetical protein